MIVQSFEEFCARNGYERPLDDHSCFKMPHGFTKADRRRPLRKLMAGIATYDKARSEYDRLVELGEVRPPTDQESLERTAQGHDDNPTVQAARRVLEKREQRRRSAIE